MSETIKVWDEIRPGDVILYDARHRPLSVAYIILSVVPVSSTAIDVTYMMLWGPSGFKQLDHMVVQRDLSFDENTRELWRGDS